MSMNVITSLNMNNNEILNVSLQSLTIAPTEAVVGQIYYNITDKRAYVYTGDVWVAMDAKDASPTAVSIVQTINTGSALIDVSKIRGLTDKFSPENIVSIINDGSPNILASKIQGISDVLTSSMIVEKINAGDSTININKVDGLNTALSNNSIVTKINTGSKLININRIDGLSSTLSGKATSEEVSTKSADVLQKAKDYINAELSKLVGGAPQNLDTLKEIADFISSDDDGIKKYLQDGLSKKTDKFSKTIGDGTGLSFDIKHNLNTQDVVVTLRENNAPFSLVYTDIEISDENTVKVKFAKAPSINQYKIIIVG